VRTADRLRGGSPDREIEVLDLLARGLTNEEIAQRLFLSEKTVRHHVSAILCKLGEPTRAGAVGRRAAPAHRRSDLGDRPA
jgi:DNA-binding NarL/FixJ family response regulator